MGIEERDAPRADENLPRTLERRPRIGTGGGTGSFSDELAAAAVQRVAAAAGSDQRIGPFRLLGQLGVGGMGTVYLAEQSEPVERKVALKVIKAGMDSEQVLARFEGERQALALMDHVNVATVYDAGSTDTGRSYFAMEHVPGHDITTHCDRAGLGFRDRVRLFLQVCDGVEHAHQKGLIHRDLKPSNILVKSSATEAATVKIIDFGVAKSMQRKLSAQAAHTQLGTFVGTPIYSSPEQIMGRFVETDTRSDIYSLGVVLYELLVGLPPHGMEDFEGKTQQEIVRMLSDEAPSSPIERFTTSVTDAAAVAERRSLSVEQMQRRLRGDISWILLKCLERRPDDRYPSVSELRKDLERWLDGLPLEARPSTGIYRLQKLVRRHRTAFAVTALVALALLATTAAAITGFVRADRAAEEAELAANFQVEQLREIDPQAMGDGLRTQLLEDIRQGLSNRSAESPTLEAVEEMLSDTNFTDLALSLLDEHLFERAELAIESKYGETPLLQARLWQSLAETRGRLGRYEEALETVQRAWVLRHRELGPDHPLTLESLRRRGRLKLAAEDLEAAEIDFRQALDARRRILGDRHPSTLTSIIDMGQLRMTQYKLEEAERYLREALDGQLEVFGEQHPSVLASRNDLALVLMAQSKLAEAETTFREVLEDRRRIFGENHLTTLASIYTLGFLLKEQGKLAEAEPYYRKALEGHRQLLGDLHPETLFSLHNLSYLLKLQGRFAEAEQACREALEGRREALGDGHSATLGSLRLWAELLNLLSRYDESAEALRAWLHSLSEHLGDRDWQTAEIRSLLGEALTGLGELDDAESYLLRGHEDLMTSDTVKKRSERLRKSMDRLIQVYEARNEPSRADAWRAKLEALETSTSS
ncbi:MAG: serine/threonine-protein kinase [Acidobacteriota bacterium]